MKSLFKRKMNVIGTISLATLFMIAGPGSITSQAEEQGGHKAYVYTELQISAPFDKVPWQGINKAIKQQAGFKNKTWLSGAGNNSAGGFYVFDSLENAQKFVNDYFPKEAAKFGVAQTTRIFDAIATKEASKGMKSVHYMTATQKPGAYVYTEVQLSVLPFDKAPWRTQNPKLLKQQGLLSKTWLSGANTGTIGGFYAFDTLENAKTFAIEVFPKTAESLKAAFYTRVFDASQTEAASRDMSSPFYK